MDNNVAIIVNPHKPQCLELCGQLTDYLCRHQIAVFANQDQSFFTIDQLSGQDFSLATLAIVIGGDGTILTAGRYLAPFNVPICGVNLGRVGFLAEIEPENLLAILPSILAKDYHIQERMMLKCSHIRDNKQIDCGHAFNDVVLNNSIYAGTVSFDLSIDNQYIHSYQADGLIVSSPTGSTGYSFSAGGPIIMPEMDLLLILPICPHTFFSRPIVAASTSVVQVLCSDFNDDVILSMDGQYCFDIQRGDILRIAVSEYRVKMIRLETGSQFMRIKRKLYQS